MKGGPDGQAVRAIYVSALVNRSSVRYALTCMGYNDTSSRPPKDLGGALRRTSRTVLWSYDSRASGDLQYPLSPGMRGKYGVKASKQDSPAAPEHCRFMYAGTDFPARLALPRRYL